VILAQDLVPPSTVRAAVEQGLDEHQPTALGRVLGRQLLRGPYDPTRFARLSRWYERNSADHQNYQALGGAITAAWVRRTARTLDENPRTLDDLFRGADAPPVGEDARAKASRDYVRTFHKPLEKLLLRTTRLFLRQQAKRVAKKVPAIVAVEADKGLAVVTRISEEDLAALLDAAGEQGKMQASLRGPVRRALVAAIKRALEAMAQAGLVVPPDQVDGLVNSQLGELVVGATAYMVQVVKRVVEQGIAAGASVNGMQAALQRSGAFAPSRALRIARTETTRSVSAGTDKAIDAVREAGVQVRKQWLSARDDVVRETHTEMDGQMVDAGEDFVAPGGETAAGPGLFADASLSVNCRCSVLPVVVEDE